MHWLYPWTYEETLWVLGFVCLYGLYVRRLWRTGRLLLQPSRAWGYKFVVRSLYVCLVLIALLGPAFHSEKQDIDVQSKDIFFCIDVSSSMDAVDVSPSRIEKVKLELKDMVLSLAGNRMGLIIFSSEAFLQCPLTYDVSALGLFIDALQTDLVPRGGTDLGAAIRMGQQKLQKAAKNTHHATTQVLVLLSDGEDFGEHKEKIGRKLKEMGTHLFTVGVGSLAGSPIPTAHGVRKDKKGNTIHTSLMRKPLQQIGHRYFEINQSSSQRPQLLAEIKRLRGSKQSTQQANVQSNIYHYYLLVAACLFILDLLLPKTLFRL